MDHQLELLLVGSTFKRINISEIKSLAIIVPPRDEQDEVCKALDTGMVAYDTAISRLEREIDLLREYRTRLVADVVTGKLDVREAATRLPDEHLLPDLDAADVESDDLPIVDEADA
jgi:type I restriction enzyme S subunit